MDCKYDVFLSYTSCDQEWVVKLKEALVKAGLKVWQDKDEIRPGDNTLEAIGKGIEASKTVVLVFSPEAMNSGWVHGEYSHSFLINIKKEKPKRIIPLIRRNAELPWFLQTLQWVDFQDDVEFEKNIQQLIWGIRDERLDEIGHAPEGSPLPLDEIMLQAKHSLIISGHTLDKFNNVRIRTTLVTLFERGVHVTLILLNPHSSYSKAHEPFHILESRGLAYDQIMKTLQFFRNIFEAYDRPHNFEVLLTNYMPRFRTIVIDKELCQISLYMYGKDVGTTPEIRLTKKADGIHSFWFQTILDSLNQMIMSNDVIHLIKNGRFNENWANSRVTDILNNCLKTACCRMHINCWDTARSIILGYQNDNPEMAYNLGICKQDYEPGTYTLDNITTSTEYLEPPTTFDAWIDTVLEDELKLMEKSYSNLFLRESRSSVSKKVKAALDFAPINGISLKHEIWFQEYPDILRRVIMAFLNVNHDLDLEILPNLTIARQDFLFDVLNWLETSKSPDLKRWLHLSVAAGLLGIDEKTVHAATSSINPINSIKLNKPEEGWEGAVRRVGCELWEIAKSPCRIDATNVFFHRLETNSRHGFRLVSFPDDYLETIVLLKFYEKLLKHFSKLEIYCVPRSVRCSNDASYCDVQQFLEKFPYLKHVNRFHLVENGPKIGGVNLLKLHPDVMRLIEGASALDVRGARSYEMMQGVNKEVYFGFMVCREISESVTGLLAKDRPFVFLCQSPGEYSFKGFTLRHKRQKNGRMFTKVTVNDQKNKWEGGYLATLDTWSDSRKNSYNVIRKFYSDKAPEFHWKYGKDLEIEVKNFLNAFSGRVLVIGCGSGKEVQYLSEIKCNAFGIDFSSEAIFFAQKAFKSLKNHFFVEDLYNLDTVMSGKFDGIVANAVLVHLLDREDMLDILKKIWGRLRKDGLCFVRVIEKENFKEELDQNLFGELRWFVYYTEEELKRLAKEAGFIVEETDRRPHVQYRGVYWISVLLRKTSQ